MRSVIVLFATLVLAGINCSAQSTPCTTPIASPTTAQNSQICNPKSGEMETVVKVVEDANHVNAFVVTDQNNVFLTLTDVGDSFTPIVPPGQTSVTYTITKVTKNAKDLVTSVDLLSSTGTATTGWSVVNTTTSFNPNPGSGGLPGNTPPTTVSGSGPINLVARGANGSNGSDAYCITIPLIGCIGVPGSGGGDGRMPVPNPYDLLVPSSYPAINAVRVSGIIVGSVGGNGGNGGDKYGLGGSGYDGGDAAAGGAVIFENRTSVTTSGASAHGIFVFSHAGVGGTAGSGYGAVGGGSGGAAASGGNVSLTNSGTITTNGVGAFGLYAISTGGSAGAGGDSWGIVGSGGSSSAGGNGGTVAISNSGNVTTLGSRSYGIFAQSIGGTGGNGGDSGGLFSQSGQGSPGGNGNKVTVTNSGHVTTNGQNSTGILAQSIGGNGGAGGSSIGVAALGGNGSGGGNAGAVTVLNTNTGTIETFNNSATGIQAQSIGGGGGSVGSTIGGVTIGGSASQGGHGAAVNVINAGQIITHGTASRGILAQSIGGGGGSVGSSYGAVTIGGSGGSGGSGSTVAVTNSGTIQTSGAGSDVIVAQSIGGGGGSVDNSGAAVTLGGSAANGGKGGTVTVDNSGQLTSVGDDSRGILAQSIGGGGGLAGRSSGAVSIGGSGGSGNDAGAVKVTNQAGGSISTTGVRSDGILAQSIGGGGGTGGSSAGIAAVGGSGSVGGAGNAVSVAQIGTISTQGGDSFGIFAQSVGGGGGNGGSAQSGGLELGIAIGGRGQSGGDGGQSTVYLGSVDGNAPAQANSITTFGDRSGGILVQSVGGGGGNGGSAIQGTVGTGASISVALGGSGAAGGKGGQVTLKGAGTVETTGKNASGVVLQSVGGGGGNGGMTISSALELGDGGSVSVAVGGDGGKGGNGGAVNGTLSSGSSVTTHGDQSAGIVMQSVGGGGGNGGLTVAASAALGMNGSGALAVAVGGDGSKGGDAGVVNASINSQVSTAGDNASGLIVQAIGGGGGNGGLTIAAGVAASEIGSGGVTVGVGGSGGTAGKGGQISGDYSGTLETHGNNSTGILVQSIGGGGGNSGGTVSASSSAAGTGEVGVAGNVNVGVGGNGGGGGAGGTVSFTTQSGSSVTTNGRSSSGILVQSIGGGGGNSGYTIAANAAGAGTGSASVSVGVGGDGGTGGNAGTVSTTLRSDVTTRGENSTGVVVQSVGGGGGNSGVTVSGGANVAGTGAGAVSVGVGGSGGIAGNGNSVTAEYQGILNTLAGRSTGLLIQSIGGGGGNAGGTITADFSAAGTGAGNVSVGVGGNGGGAGNGGAVVATVDSGSQIYTGGASSAGILVQSIGGGGGNGGYDITANAAGAGEGAAGVSVGVGGDAGSGGNASTVNATLNADVITTGQNSGAIAVQSIGGGGGNAGLNVSASVAGAGTGSGTVGIGIGGSGGNGGDASDVTSTVNGNLVTGYQNNSGANNSAGLLVQSIGGGGGNAGISVTGDLAFGRTGSGSVGVGIGGSGGSGGAAGQVSSQLTGSVNTNGDNSGGVIVQSLGGGGGNGAINVTGSVGIAGTGTGSVAVGIGGSGGGGGSSAQVSSQVTGNVTTHGSNSMGVLAQSLGGGGGNGGVNVSGSITASNKASGNVGVGVGGFGGGGGNANTVSSTVTGNVATVGDHSSAIVAQSLGGGGGNGGLNVSGSVNLSKVGGSVGVGVGGFGGGAGNGSTVSVNATGDLSTSGDDSNGILAQSIGGGGGDGGLNIGGALNFTRSGGSNGVAGSIGIGGFGAGGGSSSDVSVQFAGGISATRPSTSTNGSSSGIAAQSIGGGGGTGAMNISGDISVATGNANGFGLTVGVGGFGGAGGDAGKVDVTVTGNNSISAWGRNGSGILAQSIGGSGGNGGINVSGGIVSDSQIQVGVGGTGGNAGVGRTVTVTSSADVYASATGGTLPGAAGVLAQSIGGGGGNGGMDVTGGLAISKPANVPSITVGVGGQGGAAAVSDNVSVTQTGAVRTTGDWVDGIVAQSIAGGGGNGGLNVSGAINFSDSTNSGGKTDVSIVAGIGGSGGTGANAGDVLINNSGLVSTQGDNAKGIFAQSIGGGGGRGGMNVTGVFAQSSQPISVDIGGSGSTGGNAGSVTISRGDSTARAGLVSTTGSNSNAIEASSVGGGGGDAAMTFHAGFSLAGKNNASAGYAAQFVLGGSGADAGNGGAAKVTNYSDVITLGNNSIGVMAQSLGGGGGNAAYSLAATYENSNTQNMAVNLVIGGGTGDGGSGSTADVVNVGNVDTFGDNSYGILSQSVGGGGGNTALSLAYTKSDGNQLGINIGRHGGIGGAAGNVTLSSDGIVNTRGANAYGLFAQSIGNGGGNSSATSVSLYPQPGAAAKASEPVRVSVGLEGGQGGTGGDVSLNAAGQVNTSGSGATAIFAQSVGGGGGNGGGALTAAPTASVMGVSVGGSGGTGGTGGHVTVSSGAQVSTTGDDAAGILAQSIGGGGGNGGYSVAGGYKVDKVSMIATVGGNGGEGMSGGTVDVTNSGGIYTEGVGSYGALAQSIGGGGGKGGLVVDFTSVPGDTTANALALAIGGNGGDGGTGGNVTLKNTGWVETMKQNAVGLFAQSIGGGGGNGSSMLNVLSGGGAGSNSFSIGVGGSGGTGGSAGSVRIENTATGAPDSGTIITHSDNAHGIFALSVGGGGGTGSTVVSVAATRGASSQMSANSAAVSIGGVGGDGGTGGNVTVLNSGSILTHGNEAHGILAESVGGGGGQGGLAVSGDLVRTMDSSTAGKNLTLAVGGFGGTGNTAGSVSVTNSGTINVFGNKSDGIYAQSVGGGGGNGGLAIALSNNLVSNPVSNPLPWLTNVALGGFGGSGGDGGDVTVNNTGNITAHGNDSYGIFAQSVGGGGGKAGFSVSSPAWTATSYLLDTRLGGGTNGTGGIVSVNSTGSISMLGDNSQAQLAQSVNGGGGDAKLYLDFSKQAVELGDEQALLQANAAATFENAQASVTQNLALGAQGVTQASGANTSVTNSGDFATFGKNSTASLVQSIGGGGGSATSTVVVDAQGQVSTQAVLGASQSSGSDGGAISLTRNGGITTLGDNSSGSIVQSIGGGGGTLLAEVDRTAPIVDEASATASVTLGADQTTSSNGANLQLQTSGDVMTAGAHSSGLLVQSIGGGGGLVNLTGYDDASVALGGVNGTSGNGGEIHLINTGTIFTSGAMSHGVVLQSIGGGGGALLSGLDANHMSVITNSGNSGNGGNIDFTQNGEVVASGENSIGILAQSLGGGGGFVDRTFMDSSGGAGTSGNVNLVINGGVIASGRNGIGVFAQSRASGSQGDISIDLAPNGIIYAGTNGIGVQMSGGNHNQFTNNGVVYGEDGLNAWAVVGDSGHDRLDNYGTIIGQINLGAGNNQFINRPGALFVPGPQILLGSPANMFENDGTMIIGGLDHTQHTYLNGSFVQMAGGSTHAKLDFGTSSMDQLDITGTASLGGELKLALINPELVPYGHFRKTIFSAAQGITNNGIVLNTAPSVVINYQLVYPNSTTAAIDYGIEFAPAGLSRNLAQVGYYFDRIQAAGSSPLLGSTVTQLLYVPTMDIYRNSLTQFSPDLYSEIQSGLIVSNQRFGQILLDGGSVQYAGKRGMLWLDYGYEDFRHSGHDDYKRVRQIDRRGAIGFQRAIGGHWTAGMGVSWQTNSVDGNSGLWTATGYTTQLGGMIRREFGKTAVSGTLSYAWNKMNSNRVGYFSDSFNATLRRGLGTFGATARVSHLFTYGGFYFKPMVDLGLSDLLAQSAGEFGLGATALVLDQYNEAHAWVRPGGDLGHVFKFTDTTSFRPYVNGGIRSYLNGNETFAQARFRGAPDGVSSMAVGTNIGSMFEGAAGFELKLRDRLSFGAEYGRASADHYNMDRFNFVLRIPFGK